MHRKKIQKRSDQIGVDDVFEFTRSLWQKTDAPYKICIIRDMERMTEEAMNTFLKTLEEPPEKTIFLMTATHKDSLLSTVLSRVRIIEMGLLPNSLLKKTLDEADPGLPDEKKERIITLMQGRRSRLVRFLADPSYLNSQELLYTDLAHYLQHGETGRLFALADTLSRGESDKELHEFLDGFLHFLRTLIREKAFRKSMVLGNTFSFEDLCVLVDRTDEAREKIRKNVNKRFSLEELFLSFS